MCACAALCRRVCPEGRPSDDCSRCVCEGHLLFGEVLGITGAPVAGALVSLAGGPKSVHVRTDAKGLFSFRGVCSGERTLVTVAKEKFAPVTVPSSSNSTGRSWVKAVVRSSGGSQTSPERTY